MTRLFANFQAGTITDNPLSSGATSVNSAAFASLPTVSGTELRITLDPLAVSGAPEVILVTAHTASATVCTVTRGVDGSSARSHVSGTAWRHSVYASDLTLIEATVIDSIADADTTHAPSRNAVFDALALKAPLASPALSGSPTAPTQSAADNSTKIATTAYADAKVADAIADAVTGVAPSQNAVFDALALKAPLASPALTGSPTAPTQAAADNSTKIATTAYADAKVADAINDATTGIAPSQNAVFDALALKAPLASPALTGNPTAPTQSAGNNSTRVATTAYADALVADAINDSVTAIAPSQNAVFDALALKAQKTPTVGTALGTTGTVNLDFSTLTDTYQTIALTGNITFTTSNLTAGRSVSLFISAASTRTFTFPAWLFVGAAAPASVLAGKAGVLTLTSTTTADGGVYAAWAATP